MPSQPSAGGTTSYPPPFPPQEDSYPYSSSTHPSAAPTNEEELSAVDPVDNQAATDPSSLPHPTSHDIDTSVIAGDESAELQITKSESMTPLQQTTMDELNCSAPTTSADIMSTSELSSSKEGGSTNVDTTTSAVERTVLPNPDESNGEGCKDEVAVATHDGDTKTEELLESESTTTSLEKREEGDDVTPAATTAGAGDNTCESSLPKEEESSIANTTTTIVEAEVPTSTTTLPETIESIPTLPETIESETIESIPDDSNGNGEEVVTPLVNDDHDDDDGTTLKEVDLTATDRGATDMNNTVEGETSESGPVASSAEDDGVVLSSDNTKKRDAEELTADSTGTNLNEDGSGGKRQCVKGSSESNDALDD